MKLLPLQVPAVLKMDHQTCWRIPPLSMFTLFRSHFDSYSLFFNRLAQDSSSVLRDED